MHRWISAAPRSTKPVGVSKDAVEGRVAKVGTCQGTCGRQRPLAGTRGELASRGPIDCNATLALRPDRAPGEDSDVPYRRDEAPTVPVRCGRPRSRSRPPPSGLAGATMGADNRRRLRAKMAE